MRNCPGNCVFAYRFCMFFISHPSYLHSSLLAGLFACAPLMWTQCATPAMSLPFASHRPGVTGSADLDECQRMRKARPDFDL